MKPILAAARGVLVSAALGVCAPALAQNSWSPLPTKIVSFYALGGANVLLLEVPTSFHDPAQCHSEFIEIHLEGRSPDEQRLMLDALHAAFLTSRNVYFNVRTNECSQRATASTTRARRAVGVRVHSN